MNSLRQVLLIGTIGLLTGCASTPQARIEKHPSKYAALPPSHKAMVAEGRIVEGMSKDAVFIALGSPNAVLEGGAGGKAVERWRYNGYYPVWTNSYCVGYGGGYPGGRYASYGPSVEYIPYTQAEVEFANDRVTKWQRLR